MKLIQTRAYKESDFNFIINSYLKSYRDSLEARAMINEVYFPTFTEQFKKLLNTSTILVATSPDDNDQILGYVIGGEAYGVPLLHYVYTKYPFRQMGVAKVLAGTLIEGFGGRLVICTHLPKYWTEYAKKYNLVFDPKYRASI